jgi:hypothetical protein
MLKRENKASIYCRKVGQKVFSIFDFGQKKCPKMKRGERLLKKEKSNTIVTEM